ncbi:MAG: sigma-70 family RNA polymerase sigma factor [Phycisphaerales bacterium]|nr:sigma-70 family RNA polymerase sigma factor [Phycisphaerales bacterium]
MSPPPALASLSPDDTDWLHVLWETNRRWVAALILAHMPRGAELEDLLQEVAMRLVREGLSLRDPASVKPWLRTVAINVARTSGRRQSVRQRVIAGGAEIDADRTPDRGEAAGPSGDDKEQAGLAMRMALDLPEEYREPLLLKAVRGLSYKQISEILGIPVTTIETRLVRARRMVRDRLEAQAAAARAGGEAPPAARRGEA